MFEGALAELVSACAAGGTTTAWALYLGLSPFLVGMLGALPVVALFAQPPSMALSRRLGTRTFALWAIGLSRQCVLPLALLPFVPVGATARQAIFLVCTLLGAALGVAGNNAWTAWMGELVPQPVRGRYFGRRNASCALASAGSSLVAGLVLQGGAKDGHAGLALAALALVASAAGALTSLLLRRHQRPQAEAVDSAHVDAAPDPRARRLLVFQAAWSGATGLAAAFYPLHMVGGLGMGFASVALYGAGVAAFRTLTSPLWAWLVERRGARRTLIASAFALSISPMLWLVCAPGRLWPLAVDAALSGAAGAGLSLAMFHLPVALAKPRARPSLLSAIASAGGVAAGLASATGGAVVKALPSAWMLFGRPLAGLQALFLIGGAARLAAALLGLRIVE